MQIPSPQIRYLPSARRAMRPGQSCAGFRPVLSAPAGVRVCLLSEGPTQASHLQGKYPGTGEAGSSAYADKKDGHRVGKIHYNKAHHEYTPRGRGASKDCLPKLPRWPFSDAGCTYAPGIAVHRRNGRQPRLESQVFCAASRIFGAPRAASFVVPLLPPASLLALQERTCGQRQEALMSFSTVG
jgi:hypothetical protein